MTAVKLRAALLMLTLWVSSASVLAGCAGTTIEQAPLPPRPTLDSVTENDQGGICLDRHDTKALLHYLDSLEAR